MEPVNCTPSELSIYLQALEAAYWPTSCSDTSPSVPSRTITIVSKSWQHGKKTGTFPGFRFSMTCSPSTDDPGADSSMSSQADSPVKTCPPQAKALDSTATALASGQNSLASFARYDPATHSLKTAQFCLFEDSTECCATLPRWGWMRVGVCWELPMSARHTFGRGSGFGQNWPTPDARDSAAEGLEAGKRRMEKYSTCGLQTAVQMWQTPVSDDAVDHANGKINSRGEPKLSAQVKMWQTPGAAKANNDLTLTCSGDGRDRPNKLGWAVAEAQTFPTPTASCQDMDSLERLRLSGQARGAMRDAGQPYQTQTTGSLNPAWVCALMGWPVNWTSLEPLQDATMRGWGEGWEDGIPRVSQGVKHRVQRLTAIGNGQVPQCAAMAWRILTA